MKHLHLDDDIMYNALLDKDSRFEGLFFVGVKTTGVFCRPTCTARKPKRENVEFFETVNDALMNGYRPCKICEPLDYKNNMPDWIKNLVEELNSNPYEKIKDCDIRKKGLDPNRVRRWFRKNHNITFQAYQRMLKIGYAFGRIKFGETVTNTAFDSGYESLSGFNDTFKKTFGFSPNKSFNKKIIFITRIATPLGPMLAGAIDDKLCLLEFVDRKMLETQFKQLEKFLGASFISGNSKVFELLNQELDEYFKGIRKEFSVPIIYPGTDFQTKVWNALQTIPYGKTISYKGQAIKIGNVNAVRAVAKANGDNRISIIIPCHRVIGENGSLTGYGGGIWRKQYLLDLEKATAL